MDDFNLDGLARQWEATLDRTGANGKRYAALYDEIRNYSVVSLGDRDGEALRAQGWKLCMLADTSEWAWVSPDSDKHDDDCLVYDGGATTVYASSNWIAACALYRQYGDLTKTMSKSGQYTKSIWGKHGTPWTAVSLVDMMRDVWPRDSSMQPAHTAMVLDWQKETIPDGSLHLCTPYSYEAYIRPAPLLLRYLNSLNCDLTLTLQSSFP